MVVLGLLTAVLAAVANAGAALLEAMATRMARHSATAVLSPRYLAGLTLDGTGWVLSVVALRILPIVVVQAIVAGQVAITVVASHWVFDTPLRRRDLVAAGATVVGLGLLVMSSQSSAAPAPTEAPAVALGVVFLILLVLGVVVLRTTRRAWPAALLAGLCFGGTAVAVRLVKLDGYVTEILRSAPTDPAVWALVAYAALGFWLYTVALSRGSVGPVIAILSLAETLGPGAVGLLLLGEGIRDGWWPGFVIGLVLALGSVVVLASSPAHASLAGPSTDGNDRDGASGR